MSNLVHQTGKGPYVRTQFSAQLAIYPAGDFGYELPWEGSISMYPSFPETLPYVPYSTMSNLVHQIGKGHYVRTKFSAQLAIYLAGDFGYEMLSEGSTKHVRAFPKLCRTSRTTPCHTWYIR